ncbi:uncharacterized protein LOC111892750 [Lactuca sativa]|uniref:uncharacterized protein LOC111892750 n=1 Tax=Lactuca sativa TaxID=4236 RepID=UPI000CD87B6C|nr:uncharacterized protein LOC111892750 [Lactuca sativa]
MNFMSLNVRGIGVDAKVKWETQISNYANIDVNGCWDGTVMDYEWVDSTGRSGGLTIIANIYGPQSPHEKKTLWRDLIQIMQNWPGNWLLFGDFNVVRHKEERFNSQFCEVSAQDFNRFLACPNFLSSCPALTTTAHPKHLSDHSPITLTSGRKDFGPKPFRFFNSWLLVDDIDQVVVNAWSEFRGYGPADAYMAAKLKHVKDAIRQWRKV